MFSIIKQVISEEITKDIADIKRDLNVLKDEIDTQFEEKVEGLKETVTEQSKTIHQQQIFLEYLANKDCQNKLIITGIPEGDDVKNIEELFETLLPNEDVRTTQDFDFHRLGNPETNRKPRPILTEFHNNTTEKKRRY